MRRMTQFITLMAVLATPNFASAQTYWLGRKPDPSKQEYVFDVPLPPDLAAKLTCADPAEAKYKPGVKQFNWEVGGKTYTFLSNTVAWDGTRIDTGMFAYLRGTGVAVEDWRSVDITKPRFHACHDAIVAQKSVWVAGWFQATPILLRTDTAVSPNLTVNFNADVPFDVAHHPFEYDPSIGATVATKKPQIVATVRKDTLFIAYQTWNQTKPTGKVIIVKVPVASLASQTLTPHRQVASGGTFVGFSVDENGRDYTMTAKAEEFPNTPQGDFLNAISKTWRPNVVVLHSGDVSTDLNNKKFTADTFYGVGNFGTGRLIATNGYLCSILARRLYTADENLIHQNAVAMLARADLSSVPYPAQDSASHSFDQRLIFDGTDFVSLHQGDQYPTTGLLIEKVLTNPGSGRRVMQFPAFSCPTSGNNVYFELGGLAAEPDGYPVLFAATRNTTEVSPATADQKNHLPWDLGMVFVRRDFHTKAAPANPFDIVGSGILAKGYAATETLKFDNLSWDSATKAFTKRETRNVTREVGWLTAEPGTAAQTVRATAPKLVQLEAGKYIALWEEHQLHGTDWVYRNTAAVYVTVTGTVDAKQIRRGNIVTYPNLRLHRGDDAIPMTIGGQHVAAWVTAGDTSRQLTLHTIDVNMKLTSFPLRLP